MFEQVRVQVPATILRLDVDVPQHSQVLSILEHFNPRRGLGREVDIGVADVLLDIHGHSVSLAMIQSTASTMLSPTNAVNGAASAATVSLAAQPVRTRHPVPPKRCAA